jgi:hypothetical protein
MNEKFNEESTKNFEVQSARRELKEHLDCARKHRRCKKFKKWPQRNKLQHSWCWVVRFGMEEDKSSDQAKSKWRSIVEIQKEIKGRVS